MDLGARTLVVFSHPNHELSVFGTLMRIKPKIVFLTDGGGQNRIDETTAGLKRLGIYEKAVFLNHTEASFYNGLIRKSSSFFRAVAEEVRQVVADECPDQILCDAVEFYNPVHDLSLSITARAAGGMSKIFEVPLIYQQPSKTDVYHVQTFPRNRKTFEVTLSDDERAAKRAALTEVYGILMKTMGPLLVGSPHALVREVFSPAQDPCRSPSFDYFLRYDDRARHLKKTGKVEDEILHEEHFLPVVRDLF